MLVIGVMVFMAMTYLMSSGSSHDRIPLTGDHDAGQSEGKPALDLGGISESILTGGSIAPKLENATAKYVKLYPFPFNHALRKKEFINRRNPKKNRAELGRASWKLFHTMMARFPEKPTEDDSLALKTYVQLFARLYPCGDCASHFQKLLKKYPPQVSGRQAAAGWACFVHNEVNKRLKKEEFDCNKIGDFYDCGCGDEDGKKKTEEGAGAGDGLKERDDNTIEGRANVSLEMEEGWTRGG